MEIAGSICSERKNSFNVYISDRFTETINVLDRHPIATIDECIVSLEEASIFLTLGANSDCCRTQMDEMNVN